MVDRQFSFGAQTFERTTFVSGHGGIPLPSDATGRTGVSPFPAAADHVHPSGEVEADVAWDDITDKPTEFPPEEHDVDHTDAFAAIDHTHDHTHASEVPVGTIVMYPNGAAAPTGWRNCNGQALSRTTYATLFALIGTTYGAGDGSTTFNVPNFRTKFPLGSDSFSTPATGATGGNWDHAHTGPSHDHGSPTGTGGSHNHGNIGGATTNIVSSTGNRTYTHGAGGERHTHEVPADGVHSHGISSGGTGATSQNNPPWLAIMFIIKTG